MLCSIACGTVAGFDVMKTAVPGMRSIPPCARLVTKGLSSMASDSSRWPSNSRPRFQVVSRMNTTRPKASGNQPPSGIFTILAKKKPKSITRKGIAPTKARSGLHFQSRTATATASTLVISIVPVTAIPYAAARLEEDPKPMTNPTMEISSIQLIAGR